MFLADLIKVQFLDDHMIASIKRSQMKGRLDSEEGKLKSIDNESAHSSHFYIKISAKFIGL